MKRINKDALGLCFLGVAVLLVFIWRATSGQMSRYETTGFFTGSIFGQIANYIVVAHKANKRVFTFLHIYILIAVFGVVLIASYFSKYFSFGYFGGAGLIICFGHSLLVLTKKK
jgi:membrane-associated HD superfamily phosphohydrolase